jgi:HPr kinase/phosphorylase
MPHRPAVGQSAGESIHATCVDIAGAGVLLLGPPGSGKSDLALRLIDTPGSGTGGAMMTARLVADDQTLLALGAGALLAAPPPAIAGRLEVRGLGLVTVPYVAQTTLRLCVELVPSGVPERLPDPTAGRDFLGIMLPLLRLAPFETSAPAKLRAALLRLDG